MRAALREAWTRRHAATGLLLLATFAVARAAFHCAGMRFVVLDMFWQFLDTDVLKNHPLAGLYTLHCQPPLFNLYLGLVYGLFPGCSGGAFHWSFLLAGFVLYACTYGLLRLVGSGRALSWGLATAFAVSPSFVLLEHLLFYTVPIAAAMALGCIAFRFTLAAGSARWFTAFVLCQYALCGLHSMFHPAYYAMTAAAGMLAMRGRWKRGLAIALLPALLLSAWSVKNRVLLGEWTGGTWLGMNFATISTELVPRTERARLAAEGRISELALVAPFSKLDAYPAEYRDADRLREYPWLHAPLKTNGWSRNLNALAYVRIDKKYWRDAVALVRLRPADWLRGIGIAWLHYADPAGELDFVYDSNRNAIRGWRAAWDFVTGGLPCGPATPYVTVRIHWVLILGLAAAFFGGTALAAARWRVADRAESARARLVLFMAFNVAYVAAVGNFLICWDNNRLRFHTDALSVAMLGYVLSAALRRFHGRCVPGADS